MNSEVFDHTSTLQLLETLISHKTGCTLRESNISTWRRTICGDLSSVFRPYDGKATKPLPFITRQPFVEGIHKAQFKDVPTNFQPLTEAAIRQCLTTPGTSPHLPWQEAGVRPSCALPYELYADGHTESGQFVLSLTAGQQQFGRQSAGAPFQVREQAGDDLRFRSYAVAPGDTLTDTWPLTKAFHLSVQGPNGFFREFRSDERTPPVKVGCRYELDTLGRCTGNVVVSLLNTSTAHSLMARLTDNAYVARESVVRVAPDAQQSVVLNLDASHHWYDFSITIVGHDSFSQRYAGRVETGQAGFSDPFMGRDNTLSNR